MNKKRLEHALKVVDSIEERTKTNPGDGFEISLWGFKKECGTTACLAGWFTLDMTFRDQGLTNIGDVTPTGVETFSSHFTPVFGDAEAFDALEAFFELDEGPVQHIFAGYNTSSLEHARERIRDVLAGAGEEARAETYRRQLRENHAL